MSQFCPILGACRLCSRNVLQVSVCSKTDDFPCVCSCLPGPKSFLCSAEFNMDHLLAATRGYASLVSLYCVIQIYTSISISESVFIIQAIQVISGYMTM